MRNEFGAVVLLAIGPMGCGDRTALPGAGDSRALQRDGDLAELVEHHPCHVAPWVFDGSDYPTNDPLFRLVPHGCTRMLIESWGAAGNSFTPDPGHEPPMGASGGGGYAAVVLTVDDQQSFWVRPGVNAGEQQGGSSSVVSFGFDYQGYDFVDLIAVAGGGGGAGFGEDLALATGGGGAGGGAVGERGIRGLGLGTRGTYQTALGGGGGTETAGGIGGRSATRGVPSGQVGPALNDSWAIGGPAGTPEGGSGGQGWFGGGGGTSAGLAFQGGIAGSGGGGASGYVTPYGDQSVLIGGRGPTPGNVDNPDRGTAGEGAVFGFGTMGRIVVSWDTEPDNDAIPLAIEVNPDLENHISVDPGSRGNVARATRLATDFAWTITGGTASGPTDGPELSFDATGAPSEFVNLTLTATVECEEVVATRRVHTDFADTVDGPYDEFVAILRANGVTAGCAEGLYCPDDPITREQLPVFLLVAEHGAGYVPPACGSVPAFTDVAPDSPFCPWIEQLYAEGVVSGCGTGLYCPFDPVTREQGAVFLLRTLEGSRYQPPTPRIRPFPDVPVDSTFAPWIAELDFRGLTAGCGAGNYCPSAPVTRANAAVFVSETFGLRFE